MSAEQGKKRIDGMSLAEAGTMLNQAVELAMGPIRTAAKAMGPAVAAAFLTRVARECENERVKLVSERSARGSRG